MYPAIIFSACHWCCRFCSHFYSLFYFLSRTTSESIRVARDIRGAWSCHRLNDPGHRTKTEKLSDRHYTNNSTTPLVHYGGTTGRKRHTKVVNCGRNTQQSRIPGCSGAESDSGKFSSVAYLPWVDKYVHASVLVFSLCWYVSLWVTLLLVLVFDSNVFV